MDLSFSQQRLWMSCQLEGASLAYIMPRAWRITGALDVESLKRSLSEIVRRHESLRTIFPVVDGIPVARVLPYENFQVEEVDLRGLAEATREPGAQRLMQEVFRQELDLARGPLFLAMLIRLKDDEYILLITSHHMVIDGSSMGKLKDELTVLYNAFSTGKPSPQAELPIQYGDFAQWQRSWLNDEVLDSHLSYWKEKLKGAPSLLPLSTDRSRPTVQSYNGGTHYFTLSKALTAGIISLSHRLGTTVFRILVATFSTLLHRYTNSEDIVIGFPVGNRDRQELQCLIGFFSSLMVLRTDFSGNPTFQDVLKSVHHNISSAYANHDVPFGKLVEALQPERTLSYNPIFQVIFAQHKAAWHVLNLAGLQCEFITAANGTSKFDLSLYIGEEAEELDGWLEYNRDLFDQGTTERMIGHFEILLEAILADPSQRVATLPLMSSAEKHHLLVELNDTAAEYPGQTCVHHLFEKQVEKCSKDIAVVFQKQQVTYHELNRRANQLAHHLRKLGVGPDIPVGLCIERGVDMIVGLLGTLKAGGAYIPMDPAYPKARLALMVGDAKPPVLLTQQALLGVVPEFDGRVFCLDRDKSELTKESTENPGISQSPETLANILYTSGSTGAPKGVALPHRAPVNLLTSMSRKPGLTKQDRMLAITSFSWDIAGVELLLPLTLGGCVTVVSHETAADGMALLSEMKRSKVTFMQATPATFHMLLEAGWKGDRNMKVICTGEQWHRDLAAELLPRVGQLWNMYAPTETCIYSFGHRVTAEDFSIPVGKPLANTQFYVLDRSGELMPPGIIGELYIGGAGVSRGYLNCDELTAQKYVPDPFSGKPGARLFRSGDWAKYTPDGTVQLLGRADDQVKIRGFRIELGEIETALAKMPGVSQAVAVVAGTGADKRLVVYVISAPKATVGNAEVRRFLEDKLPDYMLPSACVILDAFPLTPSGKVDRRKLAAMDVKYELPAADFVAPRNRLERQLVQIWERVLNIKPVGVTQNFFDLGGHSLLAVTVLRTVEKTLGKKLPLVALFQAPTIEGFARMVRDSGWSAPPVIAIRPTGSEPPFFCVYDRVDYRNLEAELGDDQPIYVLPFDKMFDKQIRRGFVDVAQEFVSRIRRVQPTGPYNMGGMCLGGRVAFAIACEFYKQGDTVGVLAILDSPAPGYRSAIARMSRMERLRFTLLDDLEFEWQILKQLNFRQQIDVIGETIMLDSRRYKRRLKWRLTKKLHGHLGSEIPVEKRDSWNLMREAMGDYCPPEPYPGRVTLFRPTKRPGDSYRDFALGWQNASIGGLEIHEIPGRHIEMLRKPSVEVLGRILSESLRKAHTEALVR
jgi:aspartate racemase